MSRGRKREVKQLTKQIDTLTALLRDIMDRQQEMIGTIHQYQAQAHAPLAPHNYVASPADLSTPTPSLYTSEDEGDLRYMQEEGLITAGELEEALKEMNFLNSEIDFQ